MQILEDAVFQNLAMAKRLAEAGFLEPFLKLCGRQDVGEEDYYGLIWDAMASVFPNVSGYFNQEIEVDTIVIFDPLVDEFCRLLARYEAEHNIAPGKSSLRHDACRDIYQSFEISSYVYDYDFRIYDLGHGRKRLVVLMGMEFCGTSDLPGALADVRCTLECQVRRLRKELGIEKAEETKKEAA